MAANGSARLHEIAAGLRAQGDGALRLRLVRNLRAGAQPLVPAVAAAAIRQLPRAGGLNRQVASQKVTVSVSTAVRGAGVRLRTTAPDTAMTDRGFVRHPLPNNNRSQWVTQPIPLATGWWTRTLAIKSPAITPLLMAAIAEANAELQA